MAVSDNRLFLFAFLLIQMCQIAVGDGGTVDQLNQLVQQGKTGEAIDLARRLDEHSADHSNLTLPLARLARSLEVAGEIEQSAEIYSRSIAASESVSASNLPAATVVVLRLAAGRVLAQSTLFDSSISVVTPVLEGTEGITDRQRNLAVSISLQAGATALSLGDSATASRAYTLALRHADETNRPIAMLGEAWAAVLQRDQPQIAATKLAEFYEKYPSHNDAPNAAQTCLQCYRLAGDHTSVNQVSTELMTRWPDSDAAIEVAGSFRGQTIDQVPDAVQHWLIHKANANELEPFDVNLSVLGVLAASRKGDSTAWSHWITHLVKTDQSGQVISDLLSALPANDAERLATHILSAFDLQSPSADPIPSSNVLEATIRWAARTQRWIMIASVAETQQPGQSQNVSVDRLFAESLIQLGRAKESHRWWVHLVDAQAVDDFLTLLRCAEVETSDGDDIRIAQQRIAVAQDAAGEDGHHLALANLLAAELQIRRTEFDAARATLESVVRTTDADASIRGRAQWTLGETYYLQRKFVEAIDAYRRVEGIDHANGAGGGQWVSAALVQAGKSFEQLGRTRDAALCYGNLLNRFPESAHAAMARQRMAALGSEQRHTDAPNSSQTIRR